MLEDALLEEWKESSGDWSTVGREVQDDFGEIGRSCFARVFAHIQVPRNTIFRTWSLLILTEP